MDADAGDSFLDADAQLCRTVCFSSSYPDNDSNPGLSYVVGSAITAFNVI
jgi:hypothetical protein